MNTYVKKVRAYRNIKVMAHRIIYLISFFFILSLFINPGIIKAENGIMGSIQGRITDQNGLPLANIEVLVAEVPESMRLYTPLAFLLPPFALEEEVDTMSADYYPYRYSSIDFPLPSIHRTLSKTDGTFLLSNIPRGKYSLWAYDPKNRGFIPAIFGIDEWIGPGLTRMGNREQETSNISAYDKNIPVSVGARAIVGPFDLVMEMGGTLSGRITDADDGTPIAGAKIGATHIVERHTYQSGPSSTEYRIVASDAEGNFILSGLPEGKYRLEVRDAEEYMVEEGYHYQWYEAPLEEEVETALGDIYTVLPGQVISGCNLTLHRGAEVFGTITNQANGEPIADVEVQFMCISSESDVISYYDIIKARSESDGTYHIAGLKAGAYVPLIPDTPGFKGIYYPDTRDMDHAQEILVKTRESVGPINFQLHPITPPGSIKGQIVDADTQIPLSGIKVNINTIYVEGQDDYMGGYIGQVSFEDFPPIPSPRMMLPPLTIYLPSSLTDSEGKFEFAGLLSGKFSLDISDPTGKYLPSYFPTIGDEWPAFRYLNYYIELSENKDIDDITIPLQRGGCLEGRVMDGSVPLAGVSVRVTKIAKANFPYPTIPAPYHLMYSSFVYSSFRNRGLTDTEGAFCLCGLEEGEYVVWAEDALGRGYKITFYSNQNKKDGKPQVLSLSPASTITGITIAMEIGATLSGTVVDTAGNHLANIPVELQLKEPATFFSEHIEEGMISGIFPSSSASTYTDEDGAYTLTGLFDGEYELMARVFESKYVSNCYSDITISSSDDNVADIVLSIGGIITGKITSTDGKPLSGITVQIAYDSMSMFPEDNETGDSEMSFCSLIYDPYFTTNPVYTAKDGTYRIKGLRDGTYKISAYDREGIYLQGDYPLGSVSVVEGEETSHIDVSLVMGGTIRGIIRDQATGSPVSGIVVLAEEKIEVNYNAQPAFGYAPMGENSVYGTTYYPGPYQSAVVPYPPAGRTYYSSPSDNQGRFILQGLPEGSYFVSVLSGNSYQPQYYSGASTQEGAQMVAVSSAQTVDNIDFNLIQGMSIEGSVRDSLTGDVIAKGCNVTLLDTQMKEIKNTGSDSLGKYKFIGLPPGTYYVQVMDYRGEYYQGGYRAEGSVTERLNPIIISQSISREKIDISLFPKASLSGKIVDEHDLTPLGNLVVIAIPAEYDPRATSSYVAPSPYLGSYPLPETPDIMSAEPYAFDMSGSPPMGIGGGGPYSPYGASFQLKFALTDEDGTYTIKNLEEGDCRILALDPAYIYEGEYYKDFSFDQWEQATIIHIKRSESHEGIDMKLHIGETYSEKDEYPYILLRDYQPSFGYIGSSSGSFSWQGSGGSGGSAASYGSPGFPAYPGGPVSEDVSVEIISDPIDQLAVGRSFIYQVQVADVDTEISLAYALKRNPAGMTIDPESGLIQWQPTHEDIGSSIVQVHISAGSDLILLQSAFQSFRLEVVEDLIPPEDIQNLTAQKGNRQITLLWTPSQNRAGDLTEQILYIDDGAGYGEGTGLGKAVTTYTVTNLENEKSYTFKITTRDDLENESAGAIVTAIPQAPIGAQPPLPLLWNYSNMNFWDMISLRGNMWNFTTQNGILGNNLSSWPW
ncbi:MAG: carboxypeptidase regulatory-like domain-containing protein [bacterium]